jgi:hypothetical protein
MTTVYNTVLGDLTLGPHWTLVLQYRTIMYVVIVSVFQQSVPVRCSGTVPKP